VTFRSRVQRSTNATTKFYDNKDTAQSNQIHKLVCCRYSANKSSHKTSFSCCLVKNSRRETINTTIKSLAESFYIATYIVQNAECWTHLTHGPIARRNIFIEPLSCKYGYNLIITVHTTLCLFFAEVRPSHIQLTELFSTLSLKIIRQY